MTNQFKIQFTFIAFLLFTSSVLFGQRQMIAVQTSKISIAKGEAFANAHKKGNEILKKSSTTPVHYNAFWTEDNRLVLVSPMKSFADLDKMSANIGANNKLIGAELGQEMGAAIEGQETSILAYRKDLSVLPPEGTDLSALNYVRWTHYYYHPKNGAKVMALAKKISDYWAKQDEGGFYFIYQPIFGSDVNRLIVAHRVKDLAAIAGLNAMATAHSTKPELMALNKEVVNLITDVHTDYGWYRADLSFLPEKN